MHARGLPTPALQLQRRNATVLRAMRVEHDDRNKGWRGSTGRGLTERASCIGRACMRAHTLKVRTSQTRVPPLAISATRRPPGAAVMSEMGAIIASGGSMRRPVSEISSNVASSSASATQPTPPARTCAVHACRCQCVMHAMPPAGADEQQRSGCEVERGPETRSRAQPGCQHALAAGCTHEPRSRAKTGDGGVPASSVTGLWVQVAQRCRPATEQVMVDVARCLCGTAPLPARAVLVTDTTRLPPPRPARPPPPSSAAPA
jgi:hypothetical protein